MHYASFIILNLHCSNLKKVSPNDTFDWLCATFNVNPLFTCNSDIIVQNQNKYFPLKLLSTAISWSILMCNFQWGWVFIWKKSNRPSDTSHAEKFLFVMSRVVTSGVSYKKFTCAWIQIFIWFKFPHIVFGLLWNLVGLDLDCVVEQKRTFDRRKFE